jgi:hypothetical protein
LRHSIEPIERRFTFQLDASIRSPLPSTFPRSVVHPANRLRIFLPDKYPNKDELRVLAAQVTPQLLKANSQSEEREETLRGFASTFEDDVR